MIQIKIERIGDGNPNVNSRAWVRRIQGISFDGIIYETLTPQVDYSQANSIGTRGVYAYYILWDGFLYEVSSPVSWKKVDQYFCRVEGDRLIRMTRSEVFECLKNGSVSMY